MLIALNVFVYAQVRHFDFVNWDDQIYLTENPRVQAGLSASNISWALTTAHSPYWHPLTWLSHMLDVTLYGMNPGPHHVTSLIIHIANSLLVFLLLRRMTKATGAPAFVAAVFAVHPLHVESIAWLAERKDVLSTLFLLLAIWAYVRYVDRPRLARYLAVICAYVPALMSKPMVVTLPAVLLLLDVWPLCRLGGTAEMRRVSWSRAIVEKLPLLALAAAVGVVTFVVQRHVGALPDLVAVPMRLRIVNALVAYVAYVGKTVWPMRLSAFYPFHAFPPVRVLGAAIALALVTIAILRVRRNHPYLAVGWFFYLVTLAPVIGLVQAGEQGLADRFMYVPMIGLLIIAAWGAAAVTQAAGYSRWLPPAAASIVVACAVAARAQVTHWRDSVALWEHATQVTPDSYIVYLKLGDACRDLGRLEEAGVDYRAALNRAPAGLPAASAAIHNSLGLVSLREGKPREAEQSFLEAVRLAPDFPEAQSNLANSLATRNRLSDAIPHFQTALRLRPDLSDAWLGLGNARLSQGQAADAVQPYRAALRLDPNLAEAHNGLGGALFLEGRYDEAMVELSEAVRLNPALPSAHLNLALLLAKRGDVAEARRHLETALSIDSGYEPARRALARLPR
jgi:Tfp pilus assembly protein PilF